LVKEKEISRLLTRKFLKMKGDSITMYCEGGKKGGEEGEVERALGKVAIHKEGLHQSLSVSYKNLQHDEEKKKVKKEERNKKSTKRGGTTSYSAEL